MVGAVQCGANIDRAREPEAALEDVAERKPTAWGESHVAKPYRALELRRHDAGSPHLPVSGDTDCMLSTACYPGIGNESSVGWSPVMCGILPIARPAAGWCQPAHPGCLPGPRLHDQLPLWAAGELTPIITDWARLTEESS